MEKTNISYILLARPARAILWQPILISFLKLFGEMTSFIATGTIFQFWGP